MSKKGLENKPEEKTATEKRQEKEIARLKLRLAKAEAMLELQKKAAEIWEMDDAPSETDS